MGSLLGRVLASIDGDCDISTDGTDDESKDGLADVVIDGINDGDKLITCCGNSEGLSDI